MEKGCGSNKFKGKFDKTLVRSLSRNLTNIRSKIELLNPRKEEKETIEREKKIKKNVCSDISVKSGVT